MNLIIYNLSSIWVRDDDVGDIGKELLGLPSNFILELKKLAEKHS